MRLERRGTLREEDRTKVAQGRMNEEERLGQRVDGWKRDVALVVCVCVCGRCR